MDGRFAARLAILSDAAKYDVSFASSGAAGRGGPGSTGNGICHAYTPDVTDAVKHFKYEPRGSGGCTRNPIPARGSAMADGS